MSEVLREIAYSVERIAALAADEVVKLGSLFVTDQRWSLCRPIN
jgi:hypothetical protein